ncbi:phosphoribosylaminoimidazolesuccinocarboxamide synthase [Emticicia sp. CRIBPO]|uniref:phosphoribosylaminoimidazolesuccinocarboxamide synthase n=1 Tax=Emticicia sp. CRIBPO TaxID=2683258 RepID=UPI00141307AC|nr:phosphoribosylaminoimidazolesuccinocarboxamide synthase [Emticicia sp. CRIBPO]NBA85695.1 phosphoribosylaminoimidazolesuccinocarboxamide synthase [Emticicia sp. CRIBPO]
MSSLKETSFNFPGQQGLYKGKVRDVYDFGDKILMIASDRISAFDVVLPRAIPCKGQVLNQIASKYLKATRDIVPNWLLETPDPNVSFGIKCTTFPVEMVVRGYLVGHAWREYKSGKRSVCGVTLPEGLKENDKFPTPIITPTTKAHEGHDEDISREEIIARGIVEEEKYKQLEAYALQLFARGTEIAAKNGLILVDTKYEFGEKDGVIYLIDEVHTPDSSRYFYAENYEYNQENQLPQKQLSKEFVREWLIANNFQGKEGQTVPEMTDEKVEEISKRYIELFENVMGEKFVPENDTDITERIDKNIKSFLEKQK